MEITGLTDLKYAHTIICNRPKTVHKGDCGRILIIAGSEEMTGAAVLASRAAMRSGTGLATLCIDPACFQTIHIAVPEVICTAWTKVEMCLDSFDAVAVGPGLGVDEKTEAILNRVLDCAKNTVVIDADGLNTLARSHELQEKVRRADARIILTPHIGEAKRLLSGLGYDHVLQEKNCRDGSFDPRREMAEILCAELGAVTVIKGPETLVAIDENTAYTNTTGNPGMATAGAGDVLTGIITSLAGQHIPFDRAARVGVFLHGLAGDLACCEKGEYGLIAGDIVDFIPGAILKVLEA